MYTHTDQIIADHKGKFFSKENMCFHHSRVGGKVYAGKYFITSERTLSEPQKRMVISTRQECIKGTIPAAKPDVLSLTLSKELNSLGRNRSERQRHENETTLCSRALYSGYQDNICLYASKVRQPTDHQKDALLPYHTSRQSQRCYIQICCTDRGL